MTSNQNVEDIDGDMEKFFKLFVQETTNEESQKINKIYKLVNVEIEYEKIKQAFMAEKIAQGQLNFKIDQEHDQKLRTIALKTFLKENDVQIPKA